jgi:hypothetical protein
MSLDTVASAIRLRADTLWPPLEPVIPLAWPNEDFERPIGSSGRPLPFVVIELRWSGGEFASVGAPGNNLTRREGHIWIFAFVPKGDGETRAHQLVARAISMFEGADFGGGILCQGAMIGGEADDEDGDYFGQCAAIPFDYDETA